MIAEVERDTACDLCGRRDSELAPQRVDYDDRTYFPKVCAVCRRRGEWTERAFTGLKWCPLPILAAVFLVPGFAGWPLLACAIAWLAAFRFIVWYRLPERILRRARELADV